MNCERTDVKCSEVTTKCPCVACVSFRDGQLHQPSVESIPDPDYGFIHLIDFSEN